ncbi:MAG TPA: DUF882 domain-containing protein [Elusimicrobiales bacterium]|nr:DUF882 domain-containing protein [Elusimicrobiales bacterium]
MRYFPVLAAAAPLWLLHCLCPAAGAAGNREVGVAELLERLPDMIRDAPPPPEVTEAEVADIEDGSIETYIFISGALAHPPPPVNLGGDGALSLTRRDNGEQVSAVYRNGDGTYNQDGLAKIRRLMRCSLTGGETAVSVKLVELLDAVEDRFGRRGLIVLSGYRAPKWNRRVAGAARWSLHMLGWAADIRVQGYKPLKVAAYAKKMRSGGVGYYPDAGFVHLDAGGARYWVVRRPRPAAPQSR